MFPEITRRSFLKATVLSSLGLMLPLGALASDEDYGYESLVSLRDLASSKGLLFGAALEPGVFRIDPRFADAVIKECNIIVPEASMKWGNLHPAANKWVFENSDKLLAFAQKNKMKMRGHALIWYAGLPEWVKDGIKQGQAQALMEEHIQAVADHYRGQILSWDVVNEAIEPTDNLEHGLRKSPWLEALGPDYIERAFRLAAQADPRAQLTYNDYFMERDPAKARAVVDLLRRLKERDAPIHAVGLQAHINTRRNFEPLMQFCKDVKEMGIEILITELDVWEAVWAFEDRERDRLVADKAKEFLETVFSVTTPKQILTWGLSDQSSWLSSSKWNVNNKSGRHIRGLPLDDSFNRKLLWKVLHDVISQVST